ncbi:MAG: uncharacterized protein KVP18_002350 [Porospora cf. gigantea A]|nr:MAG: hypothetical protein KVP18_002350 [Porospora cf. gigantea A]
MASPASSLLCRVRGGARLVDNAELRTISEAERVAAVEELHSDLSRIQGIQQDIATLAQGQQGSLDRVERDIAKVKQEAKDGCLTLTDAVEDTANLYESQGGTAGAAVGAVSGIVFGPPGMMIGAAVGGAMGAFFGHLMRRSKGAAIEAIREQTIDL